MKSKLIGLSLGLALAAGAGQYAVDWCAITPGGTTAGGGYTLNSAIGQPEATAAGALAGGGVSLTGGFWAIQALQTPGAPDLYIRRSGRSVIVSWEAVPGWNLYQGGDLRAPLAGWAVCTNLTTANGTNFFTWPARVSNQFFRLGP